MKRAILLLLAMTALFLVPSLVIKAVYGPSYWFWEGENRWVPDGAGGWTAQGDPEEPLPLTASEEVPLLLQYLPIVLPAILLVVFMFTPAARHTDPDPPPAPGEPPAHPDLPGGSRWR